MNHRYFGGFPETRLGTLCLVKDVDARLASDLSLAVSAWLANCGSGVRIPRFAVAVVGAVDACEGRPDDARAH